jgi:hypothetical protein
MNKATPSSHEFAAAGGSSRMRPGPEGARTSVLIFSSLGSRRGTRMPLPPQACAGAPHRAPEPPGPLRSPWQSMAWPRTCSAQGHRPMWRNRPMGFDPQGLAMGIRVTSATAPIDRLPRQKQVSVAEPNASPAARCPRSTAMGSVEG